MYDIVLDLGGPIFKILKLNKTHQVVPNTAKESHYSKIGSATYQIPLGSVIAVLSAPSGGKNTFVNTLVGEDEATSPIFHIDTGALIRQHGNSDHADQAKKGALIDDLDALEIIQGHFDQHFHQQRHQAVFVNGFPRRIKQVHMVDGIHSGTTKILLHLKVCDKVAFDRFKMGLEDPDRKDRKDNDPNVYRRRLSEFRRHEPLVLREARCAGFMILKCRIDRCPHTRDAARDFQRKHMRQFFAA